MIPSYFKSKIYLKTIIILSLMSFIFTFAVSLFIMPQIDNTINKLENENVNLIFKNTINIVNSEYNKIEKFKVKSLEEHKKMLQETTNVAWSILNTKYQQYIRETNKDKQLEIKNDTLQIIKNLRYKEDGYFWINDFSLRMVMHPFQESLNGTSVAQYSDPNGIYLFQNMLTKINEKNEGFVRYSWPKPGHDTPQDKISFVKGFPEWKWIIGTGTYIDDIEKEVTFKKIDVIEQIKDSIKAIKISKSGYAFIFDENGNILYHPDKEMMNKNLKNVMNSVTQKSFFEFFKNVSETKTQQASYIWNKYGDETNSNYKKISWVNYLPNAKIYIAITGYEDEVKEISNDIESLLIQYSSIKFILILFFSLLFLGMIIRPIISLSKLSKEVQSGNYNVRSKLQRNDEIGELSNAFNSMIDEISFQINNLEHKVEEQTSSLVENSEGLGKIIGSTSLLLQINSLSTFTKNVLTQLNILLNVKQSNSYFSTFREGQLVTLATSGKFFDSIREDIITPKSFDYLNTAYNEGRSFFIDDVYVGFFKSNDDFIFLYLENCDKLTTSQKHLIEIFSSIISIAFNNLNLNKEIIDTQKELLERLGEMVELKSEETAGHVKRVASISYILAIAYGISKEEAFILKLASPMHDIGKLGVPEHILKKPGKLTEEEFEIMQTHPSLGYEVFQNSKKQILKVASIVAHEHHEKWDGSGYPRGLKEEEINIYARITTIADVFDALTQKRIYKEPWSTEKVLSFFEENSGTHFDPQLVRLLHENISEIEKFREDYKKE